MEYKFTNIGGNRQASNVTHGGNRAAGGATNAATSTTGNGVGGQSLITPNVGLQEQQAAQRRMQRDGLAARDRLERQQRNQTSAPRESTNINPIRQAERPHAANRPVDNRNNLTQSAGQTTSQTQNAATQSRREQQRFFAQAGRDRSLPASATQTADHFARQLSRTSQQANSPGQTSISAASTNVRHDAAYAASYAASRATERAPNAPALRYEQSVLRLLDTALRRTSANSNDARASSYDARANLSALSQPANSFQEHNVGRAANEVLSAWRLRNLFARLESAGAERLAQQIESLLAGLMSNPEQRFTLAELIRDLRAGAFLAIGDGLDPFPLTGRARLVKEIIELMHTLDAIERTLSQHGESTMRDAKRSVSDAQEHGARQAGHNAEASDEETAKSQGRTSTLFDGEEFFLPALPKRAAAFESARFIAAHEGALLDDAGKHLFVARDGTPLKLDELMWFAAAGGSRAGAGESFDFAKGTSPLLLYGFDAVYSAIGFDGRTLRQPHYIIVQSEANQAEREWAFGQPPLSVGWLRAVIERLKDSALQAHNRLGETLEMALLDGSLRLAVICGNVRNGAPERDSFAVGGVLSPRASNPAFA